MPAPPDWIEHRRGDGELVGWMQPDGDGFVVIDLLGRRVSEPVDWLTAEETLDATGIGYLADPFELLLDDDSGTEHTRTEHTTTEHTAATEYTGHWLRVRITEVSADAIRVKKEDWGDMNAPLVNYTVSFPIDQGRLRPHSR